MGGGALGLLGRHARGEKKHTPREVKHPARRNTKLRAADNERTSHEATTPKRARRTHRLVARERFRTEFFRVLRLALRRGTSASARGVCFWCLRLARVFCSPRAPAGPPALQHGPPLVFVSRLRRRLLRLARMLLAPRAPSGRQAESNACGANTRSVLGERHRLWGGKGPVRDCLTACRMPLSRSFPPSLVQFVFAPRVDGPFFPAFQSSRASFLNAVRAG